MPKSSNVEEGKSDSLLRRVFRKRWMRYLLIALGAVALLFWLVTRLALPTIASRILTSVLDVPVSVGRVDLSLFDLALDAGDIVIGQPEGFGEEPMIRAKRLELDSLSGLFGGTLRFGEIRLDGLELLLISNPEHELNMTAFVDGIASGDEEEEVVEAEEQASESDSQGIVLLERILVENAKVRHVDQSFEEAPFELELVDARLDVQRLAVGSFPDLEPSQVELSGNIAQAENFVAPLYLFGRYGAFDDSPISVLASIRLTGCIYSTLVPVIPDNTGVILGGDGFDLDADLTIANNGMDLKGKGVVSNGGHYNFHVFGPFESLEFELPKKLLSVSSRMTGGVGRAVRSAMSGGEELLKGALTTAENLGKGTLNAAGKFVGGLGKTAKGALTGDGKEMGEGLKSATVGTGGQLVDTVGGGVRDIGESGGSTLGSLGEDPKFKKWLDEAGERHQERAGSSEAAIEQQPFPPSLDFSDKAAE